MAPNMPAFEPAAAREQGPAPPNLPPLISVAGAPAAPRSVADTGVDRGVLVDLALRTAYTVPQFTTEWLARQIALPQPVAADLLEQLREERLLDVLGQAGPLGYRYAIGARGRERAARLFEISGYVGPAPVSLDAYTAFLQWQLDQAPPATPDGVARALAGLTLTPEAEQLAGLAVSSGRSLFLYGPPGNGKTSLGHALHQALPGTLWVPHALAIEHSFIRLYDAHLHQAEPLPAGQPWAIDPRWVRIRRPFLVGGGELVLDSFDLLYSPSLRYYEAPLHLKANGGTFLIDDFGRQRVDPHVLLNRWIVPLENQVDYLTLHTGQKIQIPFHQMIIFATNLRPEDVTDPAFLRRMGYRLLLDRPTPAHYARIFDRYAAQAGAPAPPGLADRLLARYHAEAREPRCCEPRDLVERARDICRFQDRPFRLDDDVLELAWTGYFGQAAAT